MKRSIPVLTICFLLFCVNTRAQWTNVSTGKWHCTSPASFPDDNTGYIRSIFPCLFKTTNGGSSWDSLPLPIPAIDVDFIFPNNGFALLDTGSQSYLAYTTDGGGVWSLQTMPAGVEFNLIEMVNYTTGYACAPGAIYKTTNAGVSWAVNNIGPYTIADREFVGYDTVIFSGHKNNFPDHGAIIRSVDGGNTFTVDTVHTLHTSISGSHFINGTTGLATLNGLYYNYLLQTSDAGVTWDTVLTDTADINLFKDAYRISDNESYIAVSDGSGALGYVYHVVGNSYTSDLSITPMNIHRLYRGGNTLYATGQMFVFKLNNSIGIEEPVQTFAGIYPNPVKDECKITFTHVLQNATLLLTDMQGKTVRTISNLHGSSFVLKREDLPPGTYVLQLSDESGVTVKKVVFE